MLMTVLALLPILARRWFGPVRPERAARAVRMLGYLALLGFVAAKATEARDGLQLGNYFHISKFGPLQVGLMAFDVHLRRDAALRNVATGTPEAKLADPRSR